MTLLALDLGLRHTGWAVLSIDGESLYDFGEIRTAKSNAKRQAHSASDDARCVDEIVAAYEWIALYHSISAVAYEVPSGGRSARQVIAIGLAHGATRAFFRGHPLIEVTVSQARKAVCAPAKATEELAHDVLRGRWGSLIGASTHSLDAVAVGLAALRTPVAVALRKAG